MLLAREFVRDYPIIDKGIELDAQLKVDLMKAYDL
jgi:hypothetical protein